MTDWSLEPTGFTRHCVFPPAEALPGLHFLLVVGAFASSKWNSAQLHWDQVTDLAIAEHSTALKRSFILLLKYASGHFPSALWSIIQWVWNIWLNLSSWYSHIYPAAFASSYIKYKRISFLVAIDTPAISGMHQIISPFIRPSLPSILFPLFCYKLRFVLFIQGMLFHNCSFFSLSLFLATLI